jgi:hypothetical protein
VKILVVVFKVMEFCILISGYQFFRRTFSLHFRAEPVKCCFWSSVSSGNYWMSLHCCKLGQNFLTFCSLHAMNETHLVFGVLCSSFWHNFTSFDSNTWFLVPH